MKKRFRVKKHKLFYRNKYFWISLLFLLIVSLATYFLFFSDFLRIEEIKITGVEKISSGEIEALVNQFKASSIILVDTNWIEKAVAIAFPQIDEITATRRLPNALEIIVKEREFFATACTANQECYAIDKKGVFFKKITDEVDGLLIKISDVEALFKLGDIAIKPDYLFNISEVEKKLAENPGTKAVEFSVSGSKLEVKTEQGFGIYFNLEKEISTQLDNLFLVLSEELASQNLKNLEYIDLRFGNKVFYK